MRMNHKVAKNSARLCVIVVNPNKVLRVLK